MTDTRSEFRQREHQNLDNIFLQTVKFAKGERIAIQGLKDFSVIPVISQRLKDDNLIAVVSSEKKSALKLSSYIKEYKKGDKFISLLWNLDNITKLKDEQFHLVALIGIEQLKKEPVAYLSSYFRLLKEKGKLTIIMEESNRNDVFLQRLLYEAEMGEMIGLLEKVGFSKRFFVKKIINGGFKALAITALKSKINISCCFQ